MGNVVLEHDVFLKHYLSVSQGVRVCSLYRSVLQKTSVRMSRYLSSEGHTHTGVCWGQRSVRIWLFIMFYMFLFFSQDFIPDFPYEPDAYDEELLR